MIYNQRLMRARLWIYGIGALIMGAVVLWKFVLE
jgi:hypothetical protein